MATVRQAELIGDLLARLDAGDTALCRPVIDRLLDLGYTPKKHKKNSFVVAFEKYGKIIAKMEVGSGKELLLWLRFSAAEDYSPVFQKAVKRRPEAWVKRGQDWVNHDATKCCGLCRGNPRFYHHINESGSVVQRCGGYTVPVPGLAAQDVPEILRLIREQDKYFAELNA